MADKSVQAAGLPPVARLLFLGAVLCGAALDGGAASADSLDATVARILASPGAGAGPAARAADIRGRERDLRALGATALPAIVKAIPGLDKAALVAAADILAESGHRPAAAALAERLHEPFAEPGAQWEERLNSQFALLGALARLGGSPEVPALAAVIADVQIAARIRRQAFCSLASIAAFGTPEALRAIDAALGIAPFRPRRWWNPPSPATFADLIGAPPPEPAAHCGISDVAEYSRRARAQRAAQLRVADGGRFVVFADPYLGASGDLWIAEFDAAGSPVAAADFTGVSIAISADVAIPEESAVSLGGTRKRLELRFAEAGRDPVRLDLAALRQDSDGDGITDRAEARLPLDAQTADTDADGLRDAEDPAPNARAGPPRGEAQEIAAAIVQQFFLFDTSAGMRPAIIVSDFALEWRGRQGPTFTLGETAEKAFRTRTGATEIEAIEIRLESHHPSDASDRGDGASDAKHLDGKGSDAKHVILRLGRGRYNLVMRRVGPRWLLTEATSDSQLSEKR